MINGGQKRRICGLVPRTFWIIAALLVIGITGAIIGGVLGAVLPKKNNIDAPLQGPEANATSATPQLLSSSQLAAVNWTDSNHNTHYAVFSQDSSNSLVVSLWDSRNQTWTAVNVSHSLAASGSPITLKSGTPLAAISTGPPHYDFEMHVTFLTPSNIITTVVTKDVTGNNWALGDLMRASPRTADSNSTLASLWDRCDTGPACRGNILIAYQTGNNLMLLNSSDWNTPQQAMGTLGLVSGSLLNMIPVGGSELRLYFYDPKYILTELKRMKDGGWIYGEPAFVPSTPAFKAARKGPTLATAELIYDRSCPNGFPPDS